MNASHRWEIGQLILLVISVCLLSTSIAESIDENDNSKERRLDRKLTGNREKTVEVQPQAIRWPGISGVAGTLTHILQKSTRGQGSTGNNIPKTKPGKKPVLPDTDVTIPKTKPRKPGRPGPPPKPVPPPDIPKDNPPTPSKPHIVFIMADDLGYNDVGYHGKRFGSIADTPAIDALAYSGVRLENYYVQPSCTPTRASLLTGRYPIRLGLQLGNIDLTDTTCLPVGETTLPEKLRDLGYATHAIGKWHLGFSRPSCLPTRHGFESFFGILMGFATHLDQTRVKLNALYSNESSEWSYAQSNVYSSELYTQRAIDIIKAHDMNKPLFLYLSHQAPHLPLEVLRKYQTGYKTMYPDTWTAMKQNQTSRARRRYLTLVKSLDVSVNAVTGMLKETGMWNNTVLVFTSDNGGKESGCGNNWPLRGRKGTLFEGGSKAVGFVTSPLLPPRVIGTVQRGLMHVSDWFPTLVEGVAGHPTRGAAMRRQLQLDGKNMWPTISTGRQSPRSEILHNIGKPTRQSGKGRKKPKTIVSQFDPSRKAAIRYRRWKLITGTEDSRLGSWEESPESRKSSIPFLRFDNKETNIRLYNIELDPLERMNVAAMYPHVVDRLLDRLGFYDGRSVKPKRRTDKNALSVAEANGAWGPWLPDL